MGGEVIKRLRALLRKEEFKATQSILMKWWVM
jgi:hypothetical protein